GGRLLLHRSRALDLVRRVRGARAGQASFGELLLRFCDQLFDRLALAQPLKARQRAELVQNATDRIAGLRAVAQPVERAILFDRHRGWLGARVIEPDHLDVTAIARAARVRDDDTIAGLLFASNATQTNTNHVCSPLFRLCSDSVCYQ